MLAKSLMTKISHKNMQQKVRGQKKISHKKNLTAEPPTDRKWQKVRNRKHVIEKYNGQKCFETVTKQILIPKRSSKAI